MVAGLREKLLHARAPRRYLVDGRGCRGKPSTFFISEAQAFLLLATSPDDFYLNELRKVHLYKLYMPLWEDEELEALRLLRGERVTRKVHWGGHLVRLIEYKGARKSALHLFCFSPPCRFAEARQSYRSIWLRAAACC